MQLTKRGKRGTWWFRFTAPNGKRIFRSARTTNKRLAQEYADKLKSDMWRSFNLPEQQEKPRKSWQQAAIRYIREQQTKRTIGNIKLYLRCLDKWLNSLILDEIGPNVVDTIKSDLTSKGLCNASVNRYLEVLRAILRRAQRDWEWIDKIPTIRMLDEPKRRVRWLTSEEAEKLLAELPEHLRAMARFSLATGLREANVTGLEWSQVNLSKRIAWIHPDQFKSNKAISVPLNNDAILVLREQAGKHPDRVFTYKGTPVKKAGTAAWRKALSRAGIKDFRWHDLRHTWASWHVQNGTPLNALQELGGWSSAEMVQRYAHLGAGHLAAYAKNINSLRLASNNHGKRNELKTVANTMTHKKAAT